MSETIKQGVKSGPNHGSRNGVLKEKRILVCVIYNNRSILWLIKDILFKSVVKLLRKYKSRYLRRWSSSSRIANAIINANTRPWRRYRNAIRQYPSSIFADRSVPTGGLRRVFSDFEQNSNARAACTNKRIIGIKHWRIYTHSGSRNRWRTQRTSYFKKHAILIVAEHWKKWCRDRKRYKPGTYRG